MHLGVNAIRLCRAFTGVGRYIECLLKEWSEMTLPFDKVTLFTHTPLDQKDVAFPLDRFQLEVIGRRLPDPLWEGTALRAQADRVDVLFGPSYTLPWRWQGKCVVMNLGPPENRFPSYEWWRSRAYEKLYMNSARRADRVLVCSHSVKDRLVEIYGVPEDKISVTYLAASDSFRRHDDAATIARTRQKYGLGDDPLILFVGKMARRHYIPNLIEAFSRLKSEARFGHRLVLVGPDYLKLDIPRVASRLGVGEHVTHVPYATHGELPTLYSAAEFFVFPGSAAEGFGIPVVEAMACGTPVITTDQGSLTEVAAGAALLTPNSETEELHRGLKRMASDAELRQGFIPLGLERAKRFSWRITAEKTMQTLWEVANSKVG